MPADAAERWRGATKVEIAGKTVVVTGAGSGIGLAIAESCAMEGARLALADIELTALDQARARIADRGVDVIAVPTDVRQAADLERLRDEVDHVFGGADIVCNNAGVMSSRISLWEMPSADLEWVFGVNLWGIVHGVRAFVPGMIERDRPAHIVNTASMAALGAAPHSAGYAMSKAAVVSMSCSLRDELLETNVDVSVLLPELIRTRLAYAERNRGDGTEPFEKVPAADVFEGGLDPGVIAARVLAALREERFWILPPPDDYFMQAANAWMDGIRAASV
jgi:NAD(P)-dependent dehydrogenase (short-subunit alcohol dehydrogenase family)